jgi:serine/threonine-protein kinase Chk1
MLNATHNSQFTQQLMLFVCFSLPFYYHHRSGIFSTNHGIFSQSQTQSGSRYTPHLTRFYAALGPSLFMPLIQESLEAMNVRCKAAPVREEQTERGPQALLRLRIGGYDRRKVIFKGWVEVERFSHRGSEGCFCVMQRDVVCFFLSGVATRL